MERAIDLMVSDEICELFPAMTKLDHDENKNSKLLGVNKSSSSSSSITKKKKSTRPELQRNVWGVNLPRDKKEEMKLIEVKLQGGRDYIGVSRAPAELVMGQEMKRFKAEFTDRRGRRVLLGTHYKSAKTAALAHDEAALSRYGLAARLNFPHRVVRLNHDNNTSIDDQNKGDTMVSAS